MATEPYRWTATEALRSLRSDNLTVQKYAESLLDHIGQREPIVKAWAHIDRGQVLAQARALDDTPKSERGPLHGLAVGIKDVVYTKGTIPPLPGDRSS